MTQLDNLSHFLVQTFKVKGNTEYKTNDLHQGPYGGGMQEMIQARNITEGSDSVERQNDGLTANL